MTGNAKTIIKISLIVVFITSFSSSSFASAPIDQNDSMYKYNAMENKASFASILDKNLAVKTPEEIKAINDTNTETLKNITVKQLSSIEKSDKIMDTIKKENGLKTFIIGNNIGLLKFQIVQMEDQNYVLNNLLSKTNDNLMQIQINKQLEILGQEQKKVEAFILEQDGRFSLFGWLVGSL